MTPRFPRSIRQLTFYACLCALQWSCGRRISEKPPSPPNVKVQTTSPASMRVLFEDGHELTVKEPEVVQQSNPGYLPARYLHVDAIVFRKIATTLGVSSEDARAINVSDVKSIEYTKNKLRWCITIMNLADGGWLAFEQGTNFDKSGPQAVLDRLAKGFFDRFPGSSLRSDFREYYPPRAGSERFGTYHLRGRVGQGKFADGAGDLFDCLSVYDKDHFVSIRKIEFERQ